MVSCVWCFVKPVAICSSKGIHSRTNELGNWDGNFYMGNLELGFGEFLGRGTLEHNLEASHLSCPFDSP